jgi:hypothetical protein
VNRLPHGKIGALVDETNQREEKRREILPYCIAQLLGD